MTLFAPGGSATAPVVGFLPAGYPDPAAFRDCAAAAFQAGLAALEVGMALGPPRLDGARIAEAFARVESPLDDQLAMVGEVAEVGPVVVMAYAGDAAPSDRDALAGGAAAAGARALLVPDLPIGDQFALVARAPLPVGLFVSRREELDMIRAAPTAPIAFVYLRSSSRRTGAPLELDRARTRLADTRAALARRDVPVLVGFGIVEPTEVGALLDGGADGVVVGTALVTAADDGPHAVRRLVTRLVEGGRP